MPDVSSRSAGAFPSGSHGPSSLDSECSTSECCDDNLYKHTHNYVPHYRQCFNCVWTVDLAHLLRRFGFDVWFFTVTLGPNPDFVNESFYMENMQEDERRVSQLFSDAEKAGIVLQQRSLSDQELRSLLLHGGCLVIVLINRRRLDPGIGNEGGVLSNLYALEPAGYMGHYVLLIGFDSDTKPAGYMGYYVILIGFDSDTKEYIFHDPAASSPEQRIGVEALDQARRSFGTDEDLLVISSPKIRDHTATAAQVLSDCAVPRPKSVYVSSLLHPLPS
eukprot:gene18791-25333_t